MARSLSHLPLTALLQFEAAGRLRNFTQAAAELGSTQPAISLRMAQLEKELGVALFVRQHRGVQLTVDGLRLLEAVQQGMGCMQAALDDIAARQRSPRLTLATDFGFAAYWLMPRLPDLRRAIPELDLRIMTSQQGGDLQDEVIDIAIAFGSGDWPGCHASRLWPERVLPVCSPPLLQQYGSDGGALQWDTVPLLHLEGPEPLRWMDWDGWFARHDLPKRHATHDLSFNNYPLLIQAALDWQGVALGWLPLVQGLLDKGQLLAVTDLAVETAAGYDLLLREDARLTVLLNRFLSWVQSHCRKSD